MTTIHISSKLRSLFSFNYFKKNRAVYFRTLLSGIFLGLLIWLYNHEKEELRHIQVLVKSSNPYWLLVGVLLTGGYIFLQGFMYVTSFAAIGEKISIKDGVILFLKRNLLSVFLPAGGVSSLAFFSANIQRKNISSSQVHIASTIYGFVGILSIAVIAIPALIFSFSIGKTGQKEWLGLGILLLVLAALYYLYRDIIQKGITYRRLIKSFPSFSRFIHDLSTHNIKRKQFWATLLVSTGIELVGVAHVYIAMLCLGANASIVAATLAYIISVIFLTISPFLRGLGAIELGMTYFLIKFGHSKTEALAITFVYRLLEFWLPLIAGIASFIAEIGRLLIRIIPAILIFLLGVVDIMSVLTPPLAERLTIIKRFFPIDTIIASNYLVIMAGIALLVTAFYMLKGLRTSWYIATILCLLSLTGNMLKSLDYEEAIIAFVVLIFLLLSRREYIGKNNRNMRNIGLNLLVINSTIFFAYGLLGFYFIHERHFGVPYDFLQSIGYTIENFFIIGNDDLLMADKYGTIFLNSIKIGGSISILLTIVALVWPQKKLSPVEPDDLIAARDILMRHATSSNDYFKIYQDKKFFFVPHLDAFVSYKVAGNYAVVLESPVAADAPTLIQAIQQFDQFCYTNGWKSIYYRVSEADLPIYMRLNKKKLFLGQEAIVDIGTFTISGKSRQSLRNSLNQIKNENYTLTVNEPPIKDGTLQKMQSVSDDWLRSTGRKELVFSQGMFDWDTLKQQTIITVENEEEKMVGFLNILPTVYGEEVTYDLARKTPDAPNGVIDFMLIELFKIFKERGTKFANLGFAPLSGFQNVQEPTFAEKTIKYAYLKIKSLSYYTGLRKFKEKYATTWNNKYLVYSEDYDLMQIPSILKKVVKPD